ncbi:SLATT domain-containing protein [Streptomyces sp. AD16]|uniref:SLATT domain-containing protein n=1 Tax=Streptomyces albidoflavus TaxID=1886 RepID=UPI00279A1D83|nr:SLATT domain-containing protein [Streptomyces sp. AD16]
MSQHEEQPEGPADDARPRQRHRPRHPADLAGRPFPLGDWGQPADRLTELYEWVEESALATADWYLADRARKRRGARLLRAGTALGTAAGAALPLLDLTGAVPGASPWACLAVLMAAACVALDRYLGLTSGWMRDMATAQAVQQRLQVLQFDWASECVREVLGPTDGTAAEAADRCLGVLRRFADDLNDLVRTETADWMVEFRTGPAPLAARASGGLPARADLPAQGARPALLPGARPNMPRQRPPDAR